MPIDIPQELYDDEIVIFLADRYRTSACNIVQSFLVQEGTLPDIGGNDTLFDLEENEMEMLRGLTCGMFATGNAETERQGRYGKL